jgi:hypothetical protein
VTRTPEQRKDMRAELLSLVLDMAISPESEAEAAVKQVSGLLQTPLDAEIRLLMEASAAVAVRRVMSEVRILAGREEGERSG